MDLQFYIKNIARCLGIVDILSAMIQCYQQYTIIKCATTFTNLLSKNHNNIQQAYDLQMKPEKFTRQFIYNLQLHSPRLWSFIRAFYNPKSLLLTVSPYQLSSKLHGMIAHFDT